VTDPANVEPISGSNFGAYNAFTDWQQTQSVSAGAGVSVGAVYSSSFPVASADIYLGNFQSSQSGGISVQADTYVALSFHTGSGITVTINTTYVSAYHLVYTETNPTEGSGYAVLYLKLKAFTLNSTDSLNPDVKLVDLDNMNTMNEGFSNGSISHTNLMNEGTDPGNNMLVSSGLLDSTPEIPPQAIPAVYSGLATALFYTRNRFRRKKK
jgi:hypothetical protein